MEEKPPHELIKEGWRSYLEYNRFPHTLSAVNYEFIRAYSNDTPFVANYRDFHSEFNVAHLYFREISETAHD